MQAIIVDDNGKIISQYSSWNEAELDKEIIDNMKQFKNCKAYKCQVTHINDDGNIFKKVA